MTTQGMIPEKKRATERRIIVWFLALAWLAGCVGGISAPPHFYVLRPLSEAEVDRLAPAASLSWLTIGVGPVSIPESLDRPEIVMHVAPNRVELASFHSWAGSLRNEISHVLAENLSLLLGSDRVVLYPMQIPTSLDFQVGIEVLNFRAMPGRKATLVVNWSLTSRGEREAGFVHKSTFAVEPTGMEPTGMKPVGMEPVGMEPVGQEPGLPRDPGVIADALSRAIAELSREIAAGIGAMVLD